MSSVDVIIPCYRYGRYLAECVESVLTQSSADVRVLIIDDASPDNTAEVATALAGRDPRVSLVHHAVNKGHISTYNEGIAWASADYLMLLSADDYLLPGALSRATGLMNDRPDVGFTFGNAVELNERGTTRPITTIAASSDGRASRVLSGTEFTLLSAARNIVPTPTAVVRTAVQKRVGGYRPHLPHSGDMEMWLRLASHAAVGVISGSQAVYRRHAANMSAAYKWLPDLRQREAALNSFVGDCGHLLADAPRLRRHLRRSLGCEAVGAASAAFNEGKLDLCLALARYGLEVSPEIKRSLPWAKLMVKRLLGPTCWRAARSAISALSPGAEPTETPQA